MADQIAYVRPDGTVSSSLWTAVGAGSLWQTVDDAPDDDTTYMWASSVFAAAVLSFADPTIPAGAVIRSVQPIARAAYSGGPAPRLAVATVDGLTGDQAAWWQFTPFATFDTWWGPALPTRPNGQPWDLAAVNALRMKLAYSNGFSGPTLYASELWFAVAFNEKPTLTVDGPSGVVGTSRPTITTTYADAEGDTQERRRIRVIAAAVYGAGGFDPETAAAEADTGDELTSATSWHSTSLDDGTYKAYGKAKEAGGQWSDWDAGPAFTVTTTPPQPPTLTATADDTLARIELEIQGDTGTPPIAEWFTVDRSVDGGATWLPLTLLDIDAGIGAVTGGYDPDSGDIAADGSTFARVFDYGAPRGVLVKYRARAHAEVSGDEVTSGWSAHDADTLGTGGWWLKVIGDAASNVALNVSEFDSAGQRPKTVYRPPGRVGAVVVTQGYTGDIGTLKARVVDQADYDAVQALLNLDTTMLLQDDLGQQWWVSAGEDDTRSRGVGWQHDIAVRWIETGEPE